MSDVVSIASETIEEFIQRHRGVYTNDVANRFGMYLPDARRHLKKMERSGLVFSERETTGGNGSFLGAGLVWHWRTSRV